MMRFIAIALLGIAVFTFAPPAQAQPRDLERSERMQRLAVLAWTQCIADENSAEVHDMLVIDYRTDVYRDMLRNLGQRRVSSECFNAMPRGYRRIELNGLPFAGGLAERMIEADEQEPLVARLAMAAIGEPAITYSYTDQVANCMARGAPNLVADLFATQPTSEEEDAAFAQLAPVQNICSQNGSTIEASPIALRSMLATASYRILAAQNDAPAESETDA